MAKYILKSHSVHVRRIEKLAPLVSDSQHVMSPELGLKLVLADGSSVKWLAEANAPAPCVGDYFVGDYAVHATYLVQQAQFHELFEAISGDDASPAEPAPVPKEEYRTNQDRLFEIANEMRHVGFGTTEYQMLEKERYELIAKKGR